MLGQRLKLARKKAGLSMRELAQRMSPPISAQAISKYETGKMLPSSSTLVGLGRALGVSLDFLMGGQVEALSGIEFRKHSRTTARELAQAEALVTEQLEDYLAVEDILELASPPDPLADYRSLNVSNVEAIEIGARELRRRWQLGIDPIPSMIGLLEDKGIKVVAVDLPERIDGLACEVFRTEDRAPVEVLVVSRASSVERKRFSMAHELAHRVIGDCSISGLKVEAAMNRFASAFLMPAAHLREEVGQNRSAITYHEVMKLKRFYGVSAAALLIRLRDVGVLPASVVDYAFRTYARAWRTREPEPIRDGEGLGAFERPERFERLVWRALAEELISPLRAAQMLGKPLNMIEAEMRGPADR